MAASLQSAREAGLDPTAIYLKLMDNPDLRKHITDHRVIQALIDVWRWASGRSKGLGKQGAGREGGQGGGGRSREEGSQGAGRRGS
jgi:hypothetical protein